MPAKKRQPKSFNNEIREFLALENWSGYSSDQIEAMTAALTRAKCKNPSPLIERTRLLVSVRKGQLRLAIANDFYETRKQIQELLKHLEASGEVIDSGGIGLLLALTHGASHSLKPDGTYPVFSASVQSAGWSVGETIVALELLKQWCRQHLSHLSKINSRPPTTDYLLKFIEDIADIWIAEGLGPSLITSHTSTNSGTSTRHVKAGPFHDYLNVALSVSFPSDRKVSLIAAIDQVLSHKRWEKSDL